MIKKFRFQSFVYCLFALMVVVPLTAFASSGGNGTLSVQTDITIQLTSPPMDLTLVAGSDVDSLTVNAGNFSITVPTSGTARIRSANRYPLANDKSIAYDCTNLPDYSELVITGGGSGNTVVVTPTTPGCSVSQKSSGGSSATSTSTTTTTTTTDTTLTDTDSEDDVDEDTEEAAEEGNTEENGATHAAADIDVSQFTDVADHWAADSIEKVMKTGIMVGKDGKFRPDDTATRCEMAGIALRLRGVEPEIVTTTVFEDVNTGYIDATTGENTLWCRDHIATVAALGIVSGETRADGKKVFRPGDNVIRAEALKFLLQAAQMTLVGNVSDDPFPDVPKGIWFAQYVATAKSKTPPVVGGYQDGYFRPANSVTRGEIATIVARVLTSQGR